MIIKTSRSITLRRDGKTSVIRNDHCNWLEAVELASAKKEEELAELIDVSVGIPEDVPQQVRAVAVRYRGRGMDVERVVACWERLKRNPCRWSVEMMMDWLESRNVQITKEGRFIMYKKVKKDSDGNLVSFFDGKTIHNVGTSPDIGFRPTNDGKTVCTTGLHCSSWSHVQRAYSGTFYENRTTIALLCDPEHIIAANSEKMTLRTYYVIAEVTAPITSLPDEPPKAKEKRRAVGKNMVVAVTTDRFTIPPAFVAQCPALDQELLCKIGITDPRSRFLAITPAENDSLKGVYRYDVKRLSNGGISIRLTHLLRASQKTAIERVALSIKGEMIEARPL